MRVVYDELRQLDDGRVTGSYSEDGGSTIDAQVTNNISEWRRADLRTEVPDGAWRLAPLDRIQYILVSQDRFIGKYGYCNDALDTGNDDWNGTRIR